MDLVEAQKWAYMPDIPEGIDVARHLLSSYGKIAPEDMDAHLSSIVSGTAALSALALWQSADSH